MLLNVRIPLPSSQTLFLSSLLSALPSSLLPTPLQPHVPTTKYALNKIQRHNETITDPNPPHHTVTNGKLPNVYHFDSKAKVEEYIRTLSLPSTFFMPGFYMSNIPGQSLRPSPPNNAWTLSMPIPSSAPAPLFSAFTDTGKFIKGILNNRSQTLGKRVLGATKYYTFDEVLDTFKKAYPEVGKEAQYFEVPHEIYKGFLTGMGMPDFAAVEVLENMRLLNEGGYYGGEELEWSLSVSLPFFFSSGLKWDKMRCEN